jgi:hypothetical protein
MGDGDVGNGIFREGCGRSAVGAWVDVGPACGRRFVPAPWFGRGGRALRSCVAWRGEHGAGEGREASRAERPPGTPPAQLRLCTRCTPVAALSSLAWGSRAPGVCLVCARSPTRGTKKVLGTRRWETDRLETDNSRPSGLNARTRKVKPEHSTDNTYICPNTEKFHRKIQVNKESRADRTATAHSLTASLLTHSSAPPQTAMNAATRAACAVTSGRPSGAGSARAHRHCDSGERSRLTRPSRGDAHTNYILQPE